VILAGNENIAKLAEKIPYQDAGVIVINQSFTKDELKTVIPKENTPKLKNIFVSGTDEASVQSIFGGRQVTQYKPYFS